MQRWPRGFLLSRTACRSELRVHRAPLKCKIRLALQYAPARLDEVLVAISRPKRDFKFGGYADDVHLASISELGVVRGLFVTMLWAKAFKVKLNSKKSISFGGLKFLSMLFNRLENLAYSCYATLLL